jgi:hypothetical protein
LCPPAHSVNEPIAHNARANDRKENLQQGENPSSITPRRDFTQTEAYAVAAQTGAALREGAAFEQQRKAAARPNAPEQWLGTAATKRNAASATQSHTARQIQPQTPNQQEQIGQSLAPFPQTDDATKRLRETKPEKRVRWSLESQSASEVETLMSANAAQGSLI